MHKIVIIKNVRKRYGTKIIRSYVEFGRQSVNLVLKKNEELGPRLLKKWSANNVLHCFARCTQKLLIYLHIF